MPASWRTLPVETLQLILSLLSQNYRETIYQCALVCRNWKIAADYHLYTNVKINDMPNLIKFNRTIVEDNINLASLVKIIELFCNIDESDVEDNSRIYTLLSNLPNLQQFYSHQSPCYLQITDALLDSKLPKMRVLGAPRMNTYSNDYVTCVLLLKNRIQSILLAGKQVYSIRLCDRLNQFENLEKITVKQDTKNPIEVMDSIVEKCSTLRQLMFDFRLDEVQMTEQNISLYTPAPNIDFLKISITDDFVDRSLILYIIHKYPRLKTLYLKMKKIFILDKLSFEQFITYLSQVNHFNIDKIVTSFELIYDNIGNYWEAMSLTNPKQLENISIFNTNSDISLKFMNMPNSERITTIEYPFSDFGMELLDLFVKYGKYFGSMEIGYFSKNLMASQEGNLVLENFVKSILFGFEQLENLSFILCDIHTQNNDDVVGEKKYRLLRELTLSMCDIGYSSLISMFGGVTEIEHLRLINCKYRNDENKLTPFICIDLSGTSIEFLSIENHRNPHRGTRYLFLSISMTPEEGSKQYYYKYDFKTMNNCIFELTDELEYNDERYSTNTHIHIICKRTESVQIDYLNSCIYCIPFIGDDD